MSDNIDILLAVLPPWGVQMPPLGIASLDTFLTNKGYKTSVLDLNIDMYNAVDKNDRRHWHMMEKFVFWTTEQEQLAFKNKYYDLIEKYLLQILMSPPPVMAFSVNTANQLFTVLFVHEIRKRGYTGVIIFGGPACFQSPDSYVFKDSADIFVAGDGEVVLMEVLDMINNGSYHLVGQIPGVILPESKNKQVTRQKTEDVDYLGFPDFCNFDLSKYTKKILPVLLGRGCICNCAFCNDAFMCGSFRGKKPATVFAELKYHVEKYNIREFFFSDLLINADLNQLEQLCDLIINSSLKIKWEAQCLIRKNMTVSLFRKMKKAGCFSLAFGVESFCDKTLKAMNKPFDSVLAGEILHKSAKAGIYNKVGIIVGFPGETDADFNETLDGLSKNASAISMISSIAPCLINENSDLLENADKYGVLLTEAEDKYYTWTDRNGTTYANRKEKVKLVLEHISRYGIAESLVNLYDE